MLACPQRLHRREAIARKQSVASPRRCLELPRAASDRQRCQLEKTTAARFESEGLDVRADPRAKSHSWLPALVAPVPPAATDAPFASSAEIIKNGIVG